MALQPFFASFKGTPMLTRCKSSRVLHTLLAFALSTLGTQAQTVSGNALAAFHPVVQTNRVAAHADFAQQTRLSGTLPTWVQPSAQLAQSVDLSAPLHLYVFLQRDAAVQASFDQFVADQQNPGSPLYHQWLTPQQVGTLFGPTQADVAAVTSWLSAQGLTVASVSPSRVVIEVTGTTASVANAFHVNFAYYDRAGISRLSADAEPTIPAALSTVILTVSGLTKLVRTPQSRRSLVSDTTSSSALVAAGQSVSPLLNYGSSHYLMPKDFSLIYDINSVYTGGNTGAKIGSTTQKVAVMGQSRVATSDISTFATLAGIGSSWTLNTIIPPTGVDPGTTNGGDQDEQTLDVDRVIGTATGVTVDLVVSSATKANGIADAINYEVNTLVDPIMSISYGGCEVEDGSASIKSNDQFFQSAAAEGITTLVSSGDSGVAACATSFDPAPTAKPTAGINGLCSSGYVTCVGGTEFNDTANPSLYWATSNGTGGETALSYIPEGGWNEPASSQSSTGYWLAASGGGPSLYITKPTWQTGTGVPADGARDTPDVAFSAAGHDGYFACLGYAATGACTLSGNFVVFEGTSAAAPGMAGIVALVNTASGTTQGNINPLLYSTVTSHPTAFHDVTVTTSGVSNCSLTTPSMCNNSTPARSSLTGGLAGYEVGTGYDEVTGLGSLDVASFITAVTTTTPTFTVTPASTAISLYSGATTGNTDSITIASVDSFAGTVTMTCSVANATGTAAGTCSLASGTEALTSGSSSTDVLTITTTAGTAGTLNVTVTGTSGTTVVTSSKIVVTLTPSGFAMSANPTTAAVASGTSVPSMITLTSQNGFAGTVTLSCQGAFIPTIGTTAATSCSTNPTSVTLTSGGTTTTALTISTTGLPSGVLTATVSGSGIPTGGTIAATASTHVAVTITGPTITASAASSALPVSGTLISGTSTADVITFTSSNGFAGVVTPSCTVTGNVSPAPTCTFSPSTVTLTSSGTGTTTMTVSSTPGTSGVASIAVKGTGTSTGGILATVSNSPAITVTLTAPSFTLAANPTSLSFTSGATTGNASTIALTSVNGFAGSVTLGCSVAVNSGGYYPATCAVTAPSSALTSGGTATATLSISSTTAHTLLEPGPGKMERSIVLAGGAFFAALFLLPGLRRRKALRSLAALALLFCGIAGLNGCSGSSTPTTPTSHSSAGTYTVMVTGSGDTTGSTIAATASTTVSVTIN